MALCRMLCSVVLLHVWTVASQSGAFTESYTDDATRLRTDLLRNYDSVVPPRSKRAVEYSKAGTDVASWLRFRWVGFGFVSK